MNSIELLKTIYLGDRAIKKIILDGLNEKILIQCDCISRIKEGETTWNYYDKEDMVDGFLVFNKAKNLIISPVGIYEFDCIEPLEISEIGEGLYKASISTAGFDSNKKMCAVTIELEFSEFYLQTIDEFVDSIKSEPSYYK